MLDCIHLDPVPATPFTGTANVETELSRITIVKADTPFPANGQLEYSALVYRTGHAAAIWYNVYLAAAGDPFTSGQKIGGFGTTAGLSLNANDHETGQTKLITTANNATDAQVTYNGSVNPLIGPYGQGTNDLIATTIDFGAGDVDYIITAKLGNAGDAAGIRNQRIDMAQPS